MALFDKFRRLEETLQGLRQYSDSFFNVVLEEVISSTEAVINGRRTILAGTNNYLGMPHRKEVMEAACRAIEEHGTGTTGSRMANGTYGIHVSMEQELSSFLKKSNTIVFTTGYSANLAVLSTLVGPKDIVILDADCHASIYDGCRLGGVQVYRFRHNDLNDLEKKLKRLSGKGDILIAVEGLYSMLGDRAPLAGIAELKRRYGAWLLVDEAHSLGVLGENGRGLAEEVGVENEVDFVIGTFSKSLGSVGGYCSSNHEKLELLRFASRPYVFTASSSPANIEAARAALRLIIKEPELRHRLWTNANYLYSRLKEMDFVLGPEPSPIIPVRFKEIPRAFAVWNRLLENGVYVNMVLPPATPDGTALLRCSLSAAHSMEQVESIAKAFESIRDL